MAGLQMLPCIKLSTRRRHKDNGILEKYVLIFKGCLTILALLFLQENKKMRPEYLHNCSAIYRISLPPAYTKLQTGKISLLSACVNTSQPKT
jgi:hypothetical protein